MNGCNGNFNLADVGKKFSKDYQPSPKAKSRGVKRWAERRRLREDIFRQLAEGLVSIKDSNEKIPVFDAIVAVLQKAIFSDDKKLTHKCAETALKTLDFLGIKEMKLEHSGPEDGPIKFDLSGLNLEEKKQLLELRAKMGKGDDNSENQKA